MMNVEHVDVGFLHIQKEKNIILNILFQGEIHKDAGTRSRGMITVERMLG